MIEITLNEPKRLGDTEEIPSQLWEDAKPLQKRFLHWGWGEHEKKTE